MYNSFDQKRKLQLEELLKKAYDLKFDLNSRLGSVSSPTEETRLRLELAKVTDHIAELKAELERLEKPPEPLLPFKVLLASPGDVSQECQMVTNVLQRCSLHPVTVWDKSGAATAPEVLIQSHSKPSAYDIVVVIFWARMGEPFQFEGKSYRSSTHYALSEALSSSHPLTLLYRCTEEKSFKSYDKAGIEQDIQVRKFFDGDFFKDPANCPQVHAYQTPAHFEQRFEADLAKAVRKLFDRLNAHSAPAPASTTPSAVQSVQKPAANLWPGSPFPSLRSFTKEDAPIFFGREAETEELVRLVGESRFVAVVGASGSGKSSLVGAGLLPRLQEWWAVQFRPGQFDHPFEALFEALVKTFPTLLPDPLEKRRKKKAFIEDMKGDPATICDALTATLEALQAPARAEVLLFIDQFEELFNLVPKEAIAPFVEMLCQVAAQPRLRVIVTIRHDFVYRAIELPELAALLRQGGFFALAAPNDRALTRMVKRPAECAALEFEEGLPERMVKEAESGAGSLALMAYTLDELYKMTVDRPDKQLTFKDYEILGGVKGAIGKRAEDTFNQLEGTEEAKEELLRQVFRQLVEVDERGIATRKLASLRCFNPAQQALIEAFTKARLLVKQAQVEREQLSLMTDAGQVEVAHESLFQSWVRLQKWITEAQEDFILRRQVQNAAAEWDRKRRPDYLRWPHERLQQVSAMCERFEHQWGEVEQTFLEPEQARLLRDIKNLSIGHERRREIGDRLSMIEDTRPGVGLRKDGLPDILWLPVTPGGKIKIEKETFTVEPFYIAKYTVTYKQYQAFVEAGDGFNNPAWWVDMPKEYQGQTLEPQRTKTWNNPRENITWYQSVAFTRWLNHRLQDLELPGSGSPFIVGQNAQVRLPTEWEWQWAAQGGIKKLKYPWGEWQEEYANTWEAGVGRAIAVGMYPHGAARCGAEDMSGNVWEWCLNEYPNPKALINFNSTNSRVLRGGAFYDDAFGAASAARNGNLPSNGNSRFGFRVVVFPPIRASDL
ncbi:MAG: SUMF1/EgtB/PvdO family nonheme iron enzyme [Chloroflexi bacterium]|nr:SUMF1/EgtB/PvdO family nonheme iron enzyme [Chloroflexota bacterium]